MANDPEEKQPPASPKDEPSAVKPPAAASEPASKPPAAPAAPAAKPPAAAAPPRPPAPPKEGPVPLDNDLVKRYKERFGEAIREAWIDRSRPSWWWRASDWWKSLPIAATTRNSIG